MQRRVSIRTRISYSFSSLLVLWLLALQFQLIGAIYQCDQQEETEIPISQLLVDQIEFANVIILNKRDLVTADQLNQIEAIIHKHNPVAQVQISERGFIPLKSIINTKLYDFEMAQSSAGWMRELLKPAHTPETEEYGIKSWVYRSKKPFHPKRFYDFLCYLEDDADSIFKSCVRAKGTIWLASRHFHSFQFQKAGAQFEFAPLYLWYAEIPQEKWGSSEQEIEETKEFLKRNWTEPYGDRQQELVFIGIDQKQSDMIEIP
ncbi:hypothetical protein FGO68_gene1334 [Halteria grandinella]|uniref:CobW C-terminal domain-containing protein n=1 Tax=Halteria grandinella TaxID=5974 RepID=A0A8J8NY29_HALGN|nr:hypothetical protein FGO68_gene1334 [Halteria grandinella]